MTGLGVNICPFLDSYNISICSIVEWSQGYQAISRPAVAAVGKPPPSWFIGRNVDRSKATLQPQWWTGFIVGRHSIFSFLSIISLCASTNGSLVMPTQQRN